MPLLGSWAHFGLHADGLDQAERRGMVKDLEV